MRFTIPLIVAVAAVANAAAVPGSNNIGGDINAAVNGEQGADVLEASADLSVDKRQTPSANAQVIGDHSGAAGQAIGRILNQLLNQLFPLKDWNPARETFTKQTTALMYQNNPDPARWPAVVCYNKGWSVKDRGAISDVVSMKLSLGAFHTDYDCMYIGRHNQFYTESDGGYINYSPLLKKWRLGILPI
ncbi:hypothetical protein DDE82_005656 [Stemphylium lycopersici]|nr:hypothetical protein DDE82_005656 [Stemphylium lycopersici]